jgi:hypothetical protein
MAIQVIQEEKRILQRALELVRTMTENVNIESEFDAD